MTKKWLVRGLVALVGGPLLAAVIFLTAFALFPDFFVDTFIAEYNHEDVTVSGTVRNRAGEPLANAEVLVSCEYFVGIDNNAYDKLSGRVTADGGFSFRFERCSSVEVHAGAPRFLPAWKYNLSGDNLAVDFALDPAPEVVTAIARKRSGWELSEGPHVSLRVGPETVEIWGYDILNGVQTGDPATMDIWLEPVKKPSHDDFPATFVAGGRGGIVPFFQADTRDTSAWYKPDQAPAAGYRKTYKLQGGEAGLFVRCRDGATYAKIIFAGYLSEKNRCAGGNDWTDCHEWARPFGVLYQPDGTGNLSYVEEVELGTLP